MSTTPSENAPGRAGELPDRFRVDLTGLTLLGIYRVERKLGDGGMGSVYAATDLNLGRTVVVKVPHPRFLGEPGFRDRFAQEVSDLVRLEHPNVVRILARGEHEGLPFFVLQFLGGGSLEDRLQRRGGTGMAMAEVLPWARIVARTLDFVHTQGIVHRDVKPANILFDEQGHVFLSDFGVAKALAGEPSRITTTGVAIGSPRYMAPEQGRAKGVGPAADQYSLASMVYEALCGEAAFGDGSVVEILVRKVQEDPVHLRRKAPRVPAAVADAVMRAMARDPARRFPTCMDFVAAMEAGDTEAGSGAGVRRGRRAVEWLAVVALVTVACVALLLRGDRSPRPGPGGGVPVPGAWQEGRKFTLLERGAEPRVRLRYRARAGQVERIVMDSGQSVTMRLGDSEAPASELRNCLTCVLTVEGVDERGITAKWEVVECAAPPEPAAGAAARMDFEAFKGLAIRLVVDPQGVVTEETVLNESAIPVDMRPGISGFTQGVRGLFVTLPEERVGVGARWEVSEVLTLMGMRIVQTSTFEVLEIDGDRVRIAIAAAETAAAQKVEMQGMPPDLQVLLRSLHGSGEGEAEITLGRLVPTVFEVSLSVDVRAEMDNGTERRPFEMKGVMRTRVTRSD